MSFSVLCSPACAAPRARARDGLAKTGLVAAGVCRGAGSPRVGGAGPPLRGDVASVLLILR